MKVQVDGLRELTKALRQTDKQAPKAVSRAHKKVAGIVVRQAQANARGRPRRQRMGHIEKTIKARGSQRRAQIAAGGSRAPDIFVQEFGGRVPLFGNQQRKVLARPRNRSGWFLYPAIRETRDEVMEAYLDELDDALRDHFDQ